MTLLVPNNAEQIFLNLILNKSTPENLVIRLFSNNKTPAEGDLVGDYTEVSGGGYASQSLTPGSWTVSPGAPTQATHSLVSFGFTGAAGNVYGYFVTQATSGALMWAERFTDGPYNIANNGDEIRITPRITLD